MDLSNIQKSLLEKVELFVQSGDKEGQERTRAFTEQLRAKDQQLQEKD